MSIDAISAVGASAGLSAMSGLSALSGLQAASGAAPTTASSPIVDTFASSFAGHVDSLQAMQSNADALAVKAVTGDLNDIHDYTIAASEASVALELTAALRNKAVDAFTEIMRMQA